MKVALIQASIGANLKAFSPSENLVQTAAAQVTKGKTLNENDEVIDLASQRFLNKSAIKQHALNCAARLRPKFTRVGQDFIDEVEADVEAFVRGLRTDSMKDVAAGACIEPVDDFLTGALIEKLKPIINRQVGRIIQSKVWRQTTGVTLGATR